MSTWLHNFAGENIVIIHLMISSVSGILTVATKQGKQKDSCDPTCLKINSQYLL